MPKTMNWDAVADFGSEPLPKGKYLVTVKLDAGDEARSGKGKYMPKAEFTVVEPESHAGRKLWENYTLGTDDDPDATTGPGASGLKALFKAARVPFQPDLEDMAADVEGNTVGLDVDLQPDTSEDPRYKGTMKNKIRKYLQPGTFVAEVGGADANGNRPALAENGRPAPAARPGRPSMRGLAANK